MLQPEAVEWDEYFAMCSLQERGASRSCPEASKRLSDSRISKLRQCRLGINNMPVEHSVNVAKFLKAHQLSTLLEISHNTGIGHDTLKDVLYAGRVEELFFMFKTDALGDSQVYYSVLDNGAGPWAGPAAQEKPRKRQTAAEKRKLAADRRRSAKEEIECRSFVVRWMGYRGFIDPKFFHLPMGMSEDFLTGLLRDLYYREEEVGVSQDKRPVFFEGER